MDNEFAKLIYYLYLRWSYNNLNGLSYVTYYYKHY